MPQQRIRIVTDSTCDIPRELAEKHRIEVVPCFINYDGKSVADDGVELVREEFYTNMTSMKTVSTAAPSPGLAEKIIRKAYVNGDHVVCITAAAKLSGIYNSVRIAAEAFEPGRITLVDSGTLTMALGYQVLAAAETAEATGDLQAVLRAIQSTRERQKLYVGLATLEFLRRSGRVSWAAAGIGTLLQIKPLLLVEDGVANSLDRVRTFSKVTEQLRMLTHKGAPLERLTVLHSHNPEGAKQLLDDLQDIAPPDTMILCATAVIGVHIGPGGLGIALVSKPPA